MGGAITQLYALTYPDELRAIVLIGTGARLRVDPRYLERCEDAVRGGKTTGSMGGELHTPGLDPIFGKLCYSGQMKWDLPSS